MAPADLRAVKFLTHSRCLPHLTTFCDYMLDYSTRSSLLERPALRSGACRLGMAEAEAEETTPYPELTVLREVLRVLSGNSLITTRNRTVCIIVKIMPRTVHLVHSSIR